MSREKRSYIWWMILKETVKKFFTDNGLFLASGLSFDLLLYCMPLSLLLVSGLGYTLVGSDQALIWVQESLQNLLPGSHIAFFDALTTIVANRGPLGLVGFLLFFVLSSSLFGSVRFVLNRIFCIPKPRTFLRGKMVDFVMMIAVSLFLLLTVSVGLLGPIVKALADQMSPVEGALEGGWSLVTDLLGFVFTAALFFLLYRFSPARTLSNQALLVGCLAGSGLFGFSKLAFSWYVSLAQSITAFYGALGGLIFFFLWLFYSSTVFILGAEVGWSYQKFRGNQE